MNLSPTFPLPGDGPLEPDSLPWQRPQPPANPKPNGSIAGV